MSKTAVISFDYMTITVQQYYDLQLELLPNQMKFHPDQLKSMQQNEANTLWYYAKVKTTIGTYC